MANQRYLLLGYQYRDGDNNKIGDRLFILDDLDTSGVERLKHLLQPDWVPGQIGLPDLQEGAWVDGVSTIFHEFLDIGTYECQARGDAVDAPASEILAALEYRTANGWDEAYRPPQMARPAEPETTSLPDPF